MIKWSHNRSVVVPGSGRLILSDNSLQIQMVDTSTVGLYACQASNSLGVVTSRQAQIQLACKQYTNNIIITLGVLGLVQTNGTTQPINQEITRAIGETLELNCGEYTSLPGASVSWSKRDSITNVQQPTLGGQTVQSIETGNLFFRSLTESDSGIFQCVVTNSLTDNSLQGSYHLNVTGKLFTRGCTCVLICNYCYQVHHQRLQLPEQPFPQQTVLSMLATLPVFSVSQLESELTIILLPFS